MACGAVGVEGAGLRGEGAETRSIAELRPEICAPGVVFIPADCGAEGTGEAGLPVLVQGAEGTGEAGLPVLVQGAEGTGEAGRITQSESLDSGCIILSQRVHTVR
ncbi:hypothetical protein EYF80_058209 [Liparis tanakae]|uniref:Uncharacterized protein n=1 Tax=Liparis tanakae TaxID=230148 RepID=A0A4Z2ETN9_9TELE|nr:hypothetical protein EYF80_058209 [Liparis tanakae]